MKIQLIALLALLILSLAAARAGTVTLTVVTNPSQGGTVTGAGTYPSGSTPTEQIQAANGWYVSNVVINPAGAFHFFFTQLSIQDQGGDVTTITNDSENPALNADNTMTVTFAPLSPAISQPLTNSWALTGSQITLSAGVTGRQPIYYQWQKDSQVISNATNISVVITNATFTNSGTYILTASNAFGVTNTTAQLVVKDMLILVNGQLVTNSASSIGPALITLQSRFTNGPIFYTLDGSTPDFSGIPYSSPFILVSNCTLRAIGYRNDFLQTALSDTVALTVIPTYTVSVLNYSGGIVTLSPPGGSYTNGTVVTAMASPDTGWTFMGWFGALAGGNPTNTLTVNGNTTLYGLFGTPIATSAVGNGSVSLVPSFPLYPYGSYVTVEAVPAPGNYLASWGNALSGNLTPSPFTVTSTNPTISALFAPIPSGKISLTVLVDNPSGEVILANPTNLFAIGATNNLTAYPMNEFLGWSGDASGTNNPLDVVMNQNMVITAHFNTAAALSIAQAHGMANVMLAGAPNTAYRIDASSNLVNWTPLLTLTNFFFNQTIGFTDPIQTNAPIRMYRAVAE
jgi:Fn3 associated/Divergent InlB B-repeat domain/Immunoglobulin I-set domain